jgi:hypothetical protein
MKRHQKTPAAVSPTLRRVFGPARWFRHQWHHRWFKSLVCVVLAIVMVSVFGPWSGCTGQNPWDRWLADFRVGEGGRENPNARFGYRRENEEQEKKPQPLPAYHGDGKAELGEYSVRMFDPVTHSTLRTDFRLEGLTAVGNEAAFQRFMRGNQRFFREQVIVALRTCDPEELIDPDLDLLGRKSVARVNRTLGKRFLKDVEIEDFALYESVDKSSFVRCEPEQNQYSAMR